MQVKYKVSPSNVLKKRNSLRTFIIMEIHCLTGCCSSFRFLNDGCCVTPNTSPIFKTRNNKSSKKGKSLLMNINDTSYNSKGFIKRLQKMLNIYNKNKNTSIIFRKNIWEIKFSRAGNYLD